MRKDSRKSRVRRERPPAWCASATRFMAVAASTNRNVHMTPPSNLKLNELSLENRHLRR